MKWFMIVVCMLLTLCVGCNAGSKGLSGEQKALEEIMKSQVKLHKEVIEVKNSQKGGEFRDLGMAAPLGNGKFRIVVSSKDDEGTTYEPAEIIEAWLKQADKIRAVANKLPQGLAETSPTLEIPKVPCPPTEDAPMPPGTER